jgi:hypothetical protein
MGTKQQRLSDATQIKNRLGELVGKRINLVLRNNTTQTGLLESMLDGRIILRNMRLKSMEYPLDQITEVYFDSIV